MAGCKTTRHKLYALRQGDIGTEIDVLNGVQQLHGCGRAPVAGLAASDQAHATRALVDNRGLCCLRKVVLTRGATAIDQARAGYIAVGQLIPRQVDWMVARKL